MRYGTGSGKTGLGNRHLLKLISEPEAAVLYTLKTITPTGVKIGRQLRCVRRRRGNVQPHCVSQHARGYLSNVQA